MLKEKYQSVLDLAKELNIKNEEAKIENGQLKFRGTVKNQFEKNLLWDEIKRVGGEHPSDLMADIKVADPSSYGHHTVKSGETLSKIAKKYYNDPNKYNLIYEANKDRLKSADLIHPGDELVIPNI